MIVLLTPFESMTGLAAAIAAVNVLIIIAIIFMERKNPESTLAWVLVLTFLPIVGLILYMIFSQNIARKQIFRLNPDEEKFVSSSLKKQMDAISTGKYEFVNEEAYGWRDMIRLNQRYDSAYFTQNNSVELFTDGREKFESLIADIRNAKKSINIEYYIIKWDKVGLRLLKALEEKAKEGVEVRLLMDALGCRQITKRRIQPLVDAGAKCAFFFRPKMKIFLMRLNYRNHRKLVVIDNHIGYIGGFNIAREYLGLKEKFGYWRDTHVKIRGGAVHDINARFILDWRFASKENLDFSSIFLEEPDTAGTTGVQIVTSGPDSERQEVKRAYMKMIVSAKKNIYLQTPYFVPDASIIESLKVAALSGIDVRVMIPCMPDHIFVYWATYSYVGELIRSGVKVYIYDNGFLHAKTLVVDSQVASVGSANFDKRSFSLNFESNAIIYDRDIACKMESAFENDITLCHQLTQELYDQRSLIIRFKESIARLLTNIL